MSEHYFLQPTHLPAGTFWVVARVGAKEGIVGAVVQRAEGLWQTAPAQGAGHAGGPYATRDQAVAALLAAPPPPKGRPRLPAVPPYPWEVR